MPILKTIPTAAAILSVFASVSAAQTTFLVSLNKEGIFFGDPLTVTVFVTPWAEETLNPTVGLVIPNNFTFRKADIRVTVCQEPTSCDTHQASINGNSTVASGPEVVFENRVIDGSKSIVLIQNETGWEPRTSFRCVVQFDSVWSSDIDQNTHFVIGRLYHAKMVSNGDDTNETMVHVEHVSGKHLSISPVSMNISLDGISPNHNNDSKAIFHYVEVSAVIDRRVGDALIRLPISTDLTITQAGYTMGHGSQSMIDLSVPADNELSILLNPFAFDELASHWCQMNRCELTLIAVVVTEPRNRQGVFSHQQVSVKATVFYGANFKSRVDSETVFISLPGGEDMNNGSNAEEPDEGSGPPANNGSITTVSEDDETNATTPSADMDPSFQIGGNDNVIDPGPADIGQPENITVGYVPEVIPNDDLHEIDLAIDENATSIDQPPNTDHMELEETMEATNESLEIGSINKTRSSCRDGWWTLELQMNDRCYFFPDHKMTFAGAEAHCRELGGHLPSYHSPYGMLTLSTFWKNHIPVTELWLGLSKAGIDDDWKWTDRTQYDFRNWCDVEDQSNWANCTVISDSAEDGYCWLGKPCDRQNYFVCYEPAKQTGLWWW